MGNLIILNFPLNENSLQRHCEVLSNSLQPQCEVLSNLSELDLNLINTSIRTSLIESVNLSSGRVRNLKFATYLKFATCENTNKINELW